jgi:hypothetical protein
MSGAPVEPEKRAQTHGHGRASLETDWEASRSSAAGLPAVLTPLRSALATAIGATMEFGSPDLLGVTTSTISATRPTGEIGVSVIATIVAFCLRAHSAANWVN